MKYTGKFTRALTAGFDASVLTKASVVVGGALLNEYASAYLAIGLNKVLPANFRITLTSPLAIVNSAVTAGLLTLLTGAAIPKYAGPMFLGGMVQVVRQAVGMYLQRILPPIPLQGLAELGYDDEDGMGDYLTPQNAASARPLGDYLTPQNAAQARALGYGGDDESDEGMYGMGQEAAIADELATM